MSEHNRYTAQEMREMAGSEKFKCSFVTRTLNGGIILDCTKDVLAMLRQAADAEDELAQLKARLEEVVKEREKQIPACRGEDCKCNPTDSGYCDENCHDEIIVHTAVTAILRAARGDAGKEKR